MTDEQKLQQIIEELSDNEKIENLTKLELAALVRFLILEIIKMDRWFKNQHYGDPDAV